MVALRALASPAAIASLLLLLVNDHVLKQAWPGVVTGKLSDFAGLVVASHRSSSPPCSPWRGWPGPSSGPAR